jgi:uncharacterized protein with HEPN domain
MLPNQREIGYLWDMLQAARRLQQFTANLGYDEYLDSTLVQSAVERQFEIIGEAARRMSESFVQANPQIRWSEWIGLRNIIAHQYDDIIQEQLWYSVVQEIPILIGQLESLIPPLPT